MLSTRVAIHDGAGGSAFVCGEEEPLSNAGVTEVLLGMC